MPFGEVPNQLHTSLDVFRFEENQGGRIAHTLAEVHPQTLSSVYEERIDHGPRNFPVQQGLLLLRTEPDSQYVQST